MAGVTMWPAGFSRRVLHIYHTLPEKLGMPVSDTNGRQVFRVSAVKWPHILPASDSWIDPAS